MEQISQELSSREKPAEVIYAVKLIYAAIAVGILNTILDFSYLSSLVSARSLLFQMVFTYTIMIFLALKISQGRNWARIVFLIIFVFGLPASIPSLASHFSRSLSAGALMLLTIILQASVNILLFQKPSNGWFKYLKNSERKE